MATTETTAVDPGRSNETYVNAAVAGIVFGLIIQFVLQRMTAIGALYTLGEPSLSIGWIAHIAHSGIFAVVYAMGTRYGPLPGLADSPLTGVLTGAGFGLLLWLVNIGFIWPVWLNAVGVSQLSVPYLLPEAARPLIGHFVWGSLLGGIFPTLGALRE